MQKTHEFIDEVPWFAVERRVSKDRRGPWRGGRRDTDWTNRPPGALSQLATRTARADRLAAWRRLVPGGESSPPA
jgi:hypothetical protein